MFGRGDSNHSDTYSQDSEHIDRILSELGGMRVGVYGRQDTSDWDEPENLPAQWAESIVKSGELLNAS